MIYGCARVRVKVTRKHDNKILRRHIIIYFLVARTNHSRPRESGVVSVAVIITTQQNIVDLQPPPYTSSLFEYNNNLLCSYGFSRKPARRRYYILLYMIIITIIIASYARALFSYKYYYYYNTSVVCPSRIILLCVVVLIMTYTQYLPILTHRRAGRLGAQPWRFYGDPVAMAETVSMSVCWVRVIITIIIMRVYVPDERKHE